MNIRYPIYEGVYRILTPLPPCLISLLSALWPARKSNPAGRGKPSESRDKNESQT